MANTVNDPKCNIFCESVALWENVTLWNVTLWKMYYFSGNVLFLNLFGSLNFLFALFYKFTYYWDIVCSIFQYILFVLHYFLTICHI